MSNLILKKDIVDNLDSDLSDRPLSARMGAFLYKLAKRVNKHYSTNERWTGDYWIDGKKIYCKVLKGDGGNKAYSNAAYYLNFNENFNEIIFFKTIAYTDSDQRILNLPYADAISEACISVLFELPNKRFAIWSRRRAINRCWIIVYYTKK